MITTPSLAAFHFDSLVWDWPIAIYLFLIGISAGAATIALIVRPRLTPTEVSSSGIMQATALIAPLSIIIGLSILIFHLSQPLTFWKLMFHYNSSSIMSLGVMLFQLYTTVLLIWLLIIFTPLLQQWQQHYPALQRFSWFFPLLSKLQPALKTVEALLLLLAILLGAYTGFLLSALKTYPLLNNPVLPILFLMSGLSSGMAAATLLAVTLFKETTDSPTIHLLHRLEPVIVAVELFLLAAFFIGLLLGGGQKTVAATTALTHGVWGPVFWFGVIGIGIVLPIVIRLLSKRGRPFSGNSLTVLLCTMTLVGVFLLRFFILYTGQMTTV